MAADGQVTKRDWTQKRLFFGEEDVLMKGLWVDRSLSICGASMENERAREKQYLRSGAMGNHMITRLPLWVMFSLWLIHQ